MVVWPKESEKFSVQTSPFKGAKREVAENNSFVVKGSRIRRNRRSYSKSARLPSTKQAKNRDEHFKLHLKIVAERFNFFLNFFTVAKEMKSVSDESSRLHF